MVEASRINIYCPPDATDTEPVGRIEIVPNFGCAIKTVILGLEVDSKTVRWNKPLYELRARLATRSARNHAQNFANSMTEAVPLLLEDA
jgi:hypothetical protein